jgi:O-antigen ligase
VALSYFSPAELIPDLAPYHIQQLLIIPAIVLTFGSMSMRRSGFPMPQSILMMGLWGAVAMSFLGKLALRASMEAFVEFAVLVCLYFLVACNTFTLGRVRILCLVISICAVVMALQAIIAFHTGYMADSLVLEGGVPGLLWSRRARGWGLMSDPNDFAQFLLVGAGLLGLFWKRGDPISNLIRLGPPAAVLAYAVFLTGSRGAIFGMVAMAFVALAPRIGKLPAGVFAVLFFLMVLGLQFGGGREISVHEGSAQGRLFAWGAGIGQLKAHPLFGSGFMQFTEYNELTAHNSFVLCFAELGLFGYFFWLALIVITVSGLEKLIRLPIKNEADAQFSRTVMGMRAAFYAFLVTAWFLSRTYTVTFYILLGAAGSLIQMRQQVYPAIVKPARKWIPLTGALQVCSIIVFYVMVRLRTL